MNSFIVRTVWMMVIGLSVTGGVGAAEVATLDHQVATTEKGASLQTVQVHTGGVRKVFQGVGVITANKPAGSLTINHQAIEGLMPAMEMMFPVDPPVLTKGVRPGDTIEFDVDGKTYTIVALKVRSHVH